MSANNSLLQSINHGDGYSLDICLNNNELEMFRQMIRMQWLYRIQLLVPKHLHQFDRYGIERYHELSNLIDHPNAWPTYARVLPREATTLVKKMAFFKKLEKEFGSIDLGDEQDLGWETIYWRLVRPGNEDVGSVHADRWFWELLEYKVKEPSYSFQRLKIWIAIHAVEGKNGLMVSPGSHKKEWQWHSEVKYKQKKPVIDEHPDMKLLATESGRAVIFHDNLLHGGSENLAKTTRISVEFTLFIKASDSNHVTARRF
ncbi:MAG: hypothetical protein ACD_60C00089G0003 [uncultured bacterium]|nr:MAG: hypothetical protein ACD_60C00089G0003 [uncultured bacterium]